MARFLLVRHQVRDFSEWRPGFDAHGPKRQALVADLDGRRIARQPRLVWPERTAE